LPPEGREYWKSHAVLETRFADSLPFEAVTRPSTRFPPISPSHAVEPISYVRGGRCSLSVAPQLADPADELVLEAAVNGWGQAIVTHDVRHFQLAANELGVQVATPDR
jgi:uncharacterized membrane protein